MNSKAISTHDLAPDTDEIIGDAPLARIVHVERVEDEPMSLAAAYADGSMVTADMTFHFRGHPVLEEVAGDPELFGQYRIEESGGLEWPNGADVSAARFQQLGEITAGNMMDRMAFRDWMKRHGLIIDTAGPILGLSRKTIARYSSGESLIPKHILLACKGYDAMQEQLKPPAQELKATGIASTFRTGGDNRATLKLKGDVIVDDAKAARLHEIMKSGFGKLEYHENSQFLNVTINAFGGSSESYAAFASLANEFREDVIH